MNGRTSSATAMTLVSNVLSALYKHYHRMYGGLMSMTSRYLGIMQHRHDPSMTATTSWLLHATNQPTSTQINSRILLH
jgi:hypothetical protein